MKISIQLITQMKLVILQQRDNLPTEDETVKGQTKAQGKWVPPSPLPPATLKYHMEIVIISPYSQIYSWKKAKDHIESFQVTYVHRVLICWNENDFDIESQQ